MNNRTRKITTLGMLCAIAYVVMLVARIPIVLFLKYDPKDVVITIGGLIWGPMASFTVTVIVSFIEMLTVSDNGIIGFIMNVLQSSIFACTAALIYKKHRKMSGAIGGLFCAFVLTTVVMMLWNYFMVPIYMGIPRESVAELLIPAFLPFNIIKGGLNSAFTLLLYKPIVSALRRTNLIAQTTAEKHTKNSIGVWVIALLILATCILLILSLKNLI